MVFASHLEEFNQTLTLVLPYQVPACKVRLRVEKYEIFWNYSMYMWTTWFQKVHHLLKCRQCSNATQYSLVSLTLSHHIVGMTTTFLFFLVPNKWM
jgi:hypothetical protein